MKFWDSVPILLAPIRAGEIDSRFVDLTNDLGAAGDQIHPGTPNPGGAPILLTVSIGFIRNDGFPTTSGDLTLAGRDWPITLDPTGLVLTIGLNAPVTAAGVSYRLVLTVNKTMQGRLFIRDMTIDVLASMG